MQGSLSQHVGLWVLMSMESSSSSSVAIFCQVLSESGYAIGNSRRWERKVLWCAACSYSWATVRDIAGGNTPQGVVVAGHATVENPLLLLERQMLEMMTMESVVSWNSYCLHFLRTNVQRCVRPWALKKSYRSRLCKLRSNSSLQNVPKIERRQEDMAKQEIGV